MSWYAAHVVMMVKFKAQPQDRFPGWENIILLRADTGDQAFEKAERRAREDEGDDEGTFRWGGKPAEWVFAGVRKVVACVDEDQRPGDGTEVSYTDLEFSSREDLERFVKGEDVNVLVCDRLGDDEPSGE
jgi:Domain of unknown function (DUF4288)